MKKLKNSGEIVKVNEIQVSDDVIIQSQTSSDIAVVDITPKETSISQQEEISVDQIEVEEILGRNYQTILDAFQEYNLETIELNTNLFDITDEYPDSYYEYYSKDVTIYFFNTKTYRQVYDIFDVLAYNLAFELNEVNNFGSSSFFINLDEDIKDNNVRIVMNYKGVVWGIKMKKSEYNTIKEKLLELGK